MIFIKHENFPIAAAELIRVMEIHDQGDTSVKLPQELYGEDVQPHEWFALVGNQARAYRPTILSMDPGVKENAISAKVMRESGCSFVVLQPAWADQPVQPFAWRILKRWPEVIERAVAAHDAGRQCRIDLPLKGGVRVTNF